MAIEQVGFTISNDMAIQSGDPDFVASIKKFVKDNAHDFLVMPQHNGDVLYARKDSIPFFTFRTVSDLISTDGRHLRLETKDDRTSETSKT